MTQCSEQWCERSHQKWRFQLSLLCEATCSCRNSCWRGPRSYNYPCRTGQVSELCPEGSKEVPAAWRIQLKCCWWVSCPDIRSRVAWCSVVQKEAHTLFLDFQRFVWTLHSRAFLMCADVLCCDSVDIIRMQNNYRTGHLLQQRTNRTQHGTFRLCLLEAHP